MKKLVFRNYIVNIIIGSVFILLAAVGYFSGWIEEFLPIFIAVVLAFIALKQFFFSFRELSSKHAITILLIELLLDIGIVAAMIYYGTYLNLLIGAFIYIRGVTYLIINFVTGRDVELGEYLLHIVFITVGAFFLFTSIELQNVLILTLTGILVIIGGIYLQDGIRKLLKKQKNKPSKVKKSKPKDITPVKKDTPKESKISKELKETYKTERPSAEKKASMNKENTNTVSNFKSAKPETELPVQNNLDDTQKPKKETIKVNKGPDKSALYDKTVVELKEMARERNLTGYSQLKKSELVDLIAKTEK